MTGETLREAQFESAVGGYLRWVVSAFMVITGLLAEIRDILVRMENQQARS